MDCKVICGFDYSLVKHFTICCPFVGEYREVVWELSERGVKTTKGGGKDNLRDPVKVRFMVNNIIKNLKVMTSPIEKLMSGTKIFLKFYYREWSWSSSLI